MPVTFLPLLGAQAAEVDDFRRQMDVAGCVFDFTVRRLAVGDVPTQVDHRALLELLFGEMQDSVDIQRQQFLKERADVLGERATHDVALARAEPWEVSGLRKAMACRPGDRIEFTDPTMTVSRAEWLFQAFDDPPYSARCAPGMFMDFCRLTGLWPDPGLQVLDWVGDVHQEPERSEWSDYFDPGKEWWGGWCLTVWNPAHRTLAALMASATD